MKHEVEPLLGFEHRYTLSNKGKCYDLLRKRFLKPRLTSREGRRSECWIFDVFKVCGKVKSSVQIANAVAKQFVDNPNDYKNVYHKDRNKCNNNAWNLIWLSPDLHFWAVQLNRGKNQKKYENLTGNKEKKVFDRQDAILAIQKLNLKNKENVFLLNYYQTNDEMHLWNIFKALYNKMLSKAKSRVKEEDAYDVLVDSFLYFIDCAKRNTIQNYVFKTWLTHFEFKAKDYWKITSNIIYTDVHFEDITPRHKVVLPYELSEHHNYY